MAGTKEGGKNAAATNKAKYGPDFYKRIGTKGGKNGHTGGFKHLKDSGREDEIKRVAAIGGRKSKRKPRETEKTSLPAESFEASAVSPECAARSEEGFFETKEDLLAFLEAERSEAED